MTDTLMPPPPPSPSLIDMPIGAPVVLPGNMRLAPHQQQVFDFVVPRPFAAAWLDVGSGKTATTLAVLQAIRPIGHILVIAPVAIARSTWLDQIEEWGFPIRTKSLIVDDNDRKLSKEKRLARFADVFNEPPTMYFINQELLTRTPQINCAACHGTGGGKQGKFDLPCTVCQTGLIDQMPITTVAGQPSIHWPFQTVIIDEAQAFKSHASSRFKALARVRPAITRMIQLTGTPSPNGLHDLWSQIFLLDQGQALGHNITAFRKKWFTGRVVPGTNVIGKYIPVPGADNEIYAAIDHLVISAENTTLIKPPLTINNVNVTLPPALMKKYQDFKRDLVVQIMSNYLDPVTNTLIQSPQAIIAQNQAVLTSKLQQFASGTLYTTDPDDPSTVGQYEVIHDKKLEMAEYLVRNNNNEPVLLAYHFKSDLEQILKRFAKAGIDAQKFDGSRDMVRRWNNKEIPVMLIHPASAGHGLNLQHGGSTLIWYTLPFSLEHYVQTNGRLNRTGQKNPVTIHRLITKGTQDERMNAILSAKKLTQDNLVEAVSHNQKYGDEFLAALEAEILDDLGQTWITDRT